MNVISVTDADLSKAQCKALATVAHDGITRAVFPSHTTFDGDDFLRTVVWEFPNYQQALKCHQSKEYQAGWDLAKKTTIRHMQIVEGFSTE